MTMPFLETLSPATRKSLVAGRVAAMRGQLQDVCGRLEARVAETAPHQHADLAALAMLWCELLHLDGRFADGLSVYERVITPRLNFLPTTTQLVAADNLSVLQMEVAPDEGVSTFYHLVDRRRVARYEVTETATLLAAHDAIEKGRLTEALPLLWQNLHRAYAAGSWRAVKWAAERVGKLYLQAGDLALAFRYLIMAEADKAIEDLADATSRRGDPAIIDDILRWLTHYGNLRRHFTVACRFVARIPDLIPDGEVASLAEWLLPRCQQPADRNGGGAMRAAWEVTRELGHRFSPNTAQQLIQAALSHPEWQASLPDVDRVLVNRNVIAEAITSLAYAAPKDSLAAVVEGTLPLTTDRAQSYDYSDVVNLLCNLSELGGATLRDKIKTTLFAPGKPVSHTLAQVAGHFQVDSLGPTQWEELARQIVEQTRNTVQRLNPEEAAKPVAESLVTMTQPTAYGQLHVTLQGDGGLRALVRGQQHLSDPTIDQVVRALLDMATDRDNLLSNRTVVLSHLCGFAQRASPELHDEVVRMLEPLARGTLSESATPANSTAGLDSPLSSAFTGMVKPEDVQAMALIAAATYCGADAARARVINEALVEGFVSPDAAVRRGAYAAAGRLPGLSSEELLPVLMGLRDPDPEAAIAAFAAFAERSEWPLSRPLWKLFLMATRLASQSANSHLRRQAALALRERLGDAPTEATRIAAKAIMDKFSNDIAYSVRQVITK